MVKEHSYIRKDLLKSLGLSLLAMVIILAVYLWETNSYLINFIFKEVN
jgi:hypothetical protein